MDSYPELFARVLGIFFLFALILVSALILNMTASDARKRGKSPVLVTLLVLLSFPWGLIVWLLFRPDPIEPQPAFRLHNFRIQ